MSILFWHGNYTVQAFWPNDDDLEQSFFPEKRFMNAFEVRESIRIAYPCKIHIKYTLIDRVWEEKAWERRSHVYRLIRSTDLGCPCLE